MTTRRIYNVIGENDIIEKYFLNVLETKELTFKFKTFTVVPICFYIKYFYCSIQ